MKILWASVYTADRNWRECSKKLQLCSAETINSSAEFLTYLVYGKWRQRLEFLCGLEECGRKGQWHHGRGWSKPEGISPPPLLLDGHVGEEEQQKQQIWGEFMQFYPYWHNHKVTGWEQLLSTHFICKATIWNWEKRTAVCASACEPRGYGWRKICKTNWNVGNDWDKRREHYCNCTGQLKRFSLFSKCNISINHFDMSLWVLLMQCDPPLPVTHNWALRLHSVWLPYSPPDPNLTLLAQQQWWTIQYRRHPSVQFRPDATSDDKNEDTCI